MVFPSWIVLCFEALFGLIVNLEKSFILPMGDVECLDQLTCELGCRVETLPSTYLGLPLGSKQNLVRVWKGLMKNLEKDLLLGRDSISQKDVDLR